MKDRLLLLEKEWYQIKRTVKRIRQERVQWFETGVKCSCKVPRTSHEDYYGDCFFCLKRTSFYRKLKRLADRKRSIRCEIYNIVTRNESSSQMDTNATVPRQ